MKKRARVLLTMVAAAALTTAPAFGAGAAFPDTVPLPDGWQAEGVATGKGTEVFAGSLADGAVWKADLRTGQGGVLVPGGDGRVSVGLKESRGLLYVAGGPTGRVTVYDSSTGEEVAAYQVAGAGSFVNDVTLTRQAAWFTDSFAATLYRLPLRGGKPTGEPEAVPLTGEWQQVTGFNANGIAATPDGSTLLVINSGTGTLYRVDPGTGEATEVDTDAELSAGDGILLRGQELSVVRNQLNEIAVLRLSPDLSSARLLETLTDPDFAVPTTVAAFGSSLYAVNARFGSSGPDVPYEIVRVDGS
jgi:sugar lactone lactonase YvrE